MNAPGSTLLRTREGRLRLGWRLLLFLIVALLSATAVALVLPATLPAQGAALTVGALAGGAVLLALEGRPPGELGFGLGRNVAGESLRGLALGSGVALAAVALIAGAGAVRWTVDGGSVGEYLVAGGSALALFLLPAVGEEAFFRGYPLQALAQSMGPGPALALTSAVFGAMHLPNPGADWIGAANVTAAGLFLGAILLRTGSLWYASAAHLAWNWVHGFVADLPVSGLDLVDAPGVVARTAGPDWLSGGSFGPEGSVVTTGVALAAAAWVWWSPRWGAEAVGWWNRDGESADLQTAPGGSDG